ncbi:MAG: thermonuclease family protein [Candidatus Bipolaricaulia bacterium]
MHRKQPLIVWLVLTLCVSVVHAQPLQPDPAWATETAFVVRVFDGDTILLSNMERIRYIGIDTPEVHPTPEPYAGEASDLNQELVLYQQVKIEYDLDRRDIHDRLLAYVYVQRDGEWVFVNGELVRQGVADLLSIPPNTKYRAYFERMQIEAAADRRGMWKDHRTISVEQAEAHTVEYLGQMVTVRFRVLDAYDSGRVIFLNAGEDHRTDFTAVIFAENVPTFREVGIDPIASYRGRVVEVTGELKRFNGPEIVLNGPWQIRIIEPNG